MKNRDKPILHHIFRISVIIRSLDGLLDLFAGFMLLIFNSSTIYALINKLFYYELAEDPNDIVANYLFDIIQNLSVSTKLFGAIYLLIHGLVKIGVGFALVKNKIHHYLLTGIVLGLFTLYEIYRLFHTYSLVLLFLIIVDLFILSMMHREYLKLKKENYK
jgi:uncharacterized membrane protein